MGNGCLSDLRGWGLEKGLGDSWASVEGSQVNRGDSNASYVIDGSDNKGLGRMLEKRDDGCCHAVKGSMLDMASPLGKSSRLKEDGDYVYVAPDLRLKKPN